MYVVWMLLLSLAFSCANWEQCLEYYVDLYKTERSLYLFEEGYFLRLKGVWSYRLIKVAYYEKSGKDVFDLVMISIANPDFFGYYLTYLQVSIGNVVLVAYHGEDSTVGNVFEMLHRYGYMDVIVVSRSLKVWTYYPVSQGRCSYSVPTYLGDCGKVGTVFLDTYMVRVPNCTLKLFAFIKQPYVEGPGKGLEVELCKIIAEKLNVPVQYIPAPNEATLYQNVDVHIGGRWCAFMTHWFAVYYLQDEYRVMVPPAMPRHPWLNLAYIFDVPIWTCTLLSMALLDLVWYKAMFSLIILISSVTKQPKHLLFILWSFASLILTNSFVGLLTSFMFKVLKEKPISSLEDMAEYDWYLLAVSITIEMNKALSETFPIEKIQYGRSMFYRCGAKLNEDKVGYLMSTRIMMYLANCKQQHLSFYKFLEWNGQLCISMAKGTIFAKALVRYTLYLAENGITQHLDEYKWKDNVPELPPFQNVTLGHLYLIFAVYLCGILVSLVTFLIELSRQKCSKLKIHRRSK